MDMVQPIDRTFSYALGAAGRLFAVALLLGCAAVPAPAGAAEPRSAEVTLYLGADFSGPSRDWSLKPDQPFLAVPYTGDDFQPAAGSIKLGADVGVLLFEEPFFSSVDQTCEYELGKAGAPELWWLSDGATAVPEPGVSGQVEANLKDQTIASLILYRRALGPPPGAMLLERRRYINWDCASPTKARGYKRLFIPVAAAPHRLGCFDLDTGLSYGPAGEVMLDFSAASELLLMAPRDLVEDYDGVEHKLEVALFDQEGCEGDSVDFEDVKEGTRRFQLKELDFDRKARSVMIGYRRGAYDPMLNPSDGAPAAPAQVAAGPEDGQEAEDLAAAVDAMKAPAEPEAPAEEPEATGQATAQAVEAADRDPSEEEAIGWIVGNRVVAEDGSDPSEARASRTQAASETPPAAVVSDKVPAPDPENPVAAAPAAVSATMNTPDDPGEQAALEPLETSPALADAATESAPEESNAPETGFLVAPESEPDAGSVGQTFKYPLLQGYRLNACLSGTEGCGEAAASAWCEAKGYAGGASSWTLDENIGSLFPTLALGDSQLCASFICDGFQEITCAP